MKTCQVISGLLTALVCPRGSRNTAKAINSPPPGAINQVHRLRWNIRPHWGEPAVHPLATHTLFRPPCYRPALELLRPLKLKSIWSLDDSVPFC